MRKARPTDRPLSRRTLAAWAVLATCTAAGCRSRASDHAAGETPAGAGIQAVVLPSPGDTHLALLPSPVQLAVQVHPRAVLADETLSLAARAFLVGVAEDTAATEACLERLARDGDVVTYAWIGGIADGWVLLADADLDATALSACVRAFGVARPAPRLADPQPGGEARLGKAGEVTPPARPRRRVLGLAPTVEAVRRPRSIRPPRGCAEQRA